MRNENTAKTTIGHLAIRSHGQIVIRAVEGTAFEKFVGASAAV
jgi:hypothetical protein